MDRNYDIEEISRYIEGEMSPERREAFRLKMESDRGLKDMVEEIQAIKNAQHLMRLSLMEEKYAQWEEEYQQEKKVRANSLWNSRNLGGLILLAAVLAFLLFYVFMPEPKENTENQQLTQVDTVDKHKNSPDLPLVDSLPSKADPLNPPAEQEVPKPRPFDSRGFLAIVEGHFSNPMIDSQQKSSLEPQDSLPVDRARLALASKEYRKVIEILTPPDEEYPFQSRFLRGSAHVKLDDYEAALKDFAFIRHSPNLWQKEGEWNALLCQLALFPQESEKWMPQLEAILQNSDHPFWQEAKQLQEELQKF